MSELDQKQDFEDFSFEEQIEIVRKSPFPERADLILRSQYPETIIEDLGPENFYIIARSADRELLPELLSYADTDQLLFFTDFQCFESDKVNPRKFTYWIRQLMEASHEKFLEWVSEMDFDFIVTGYKKVIRIIKSTPEEVMDEILQDEEYFTIDFLYYICLKHSDDFETIKKSIELIFEHLKSLYINLMECVIAEILAETEEEAYLNREERLSEAGFPEKEIAVNIYKPLDREEWINLEKKQEKDLKASSESSAFSKDVDFMSPIIHRQGSLFIDEVLSFISQKDHNFRTEIDAEIMSLTNKVLVLSMQKDHDLGEDILKRALSEVKGMLNIALGVLTGNSLQRSAEILTHYWLEHIFRRGFTEIMFFRKKANGLIKKLRPVNVETFVRFFDNDYACTLKGLLKLSPKFYDHAVHDNLDSLREFRTMEDITLTRTRLETIEKTLELLIHIENLNVLFDHTRPLNLTPEEVTSRTVLFTAFANYTLNRSFSANPLEKDELLSFFKKGF
ncbi:MAG: hypothetical protein JW928_08645, partial [Candidatus Aureabacteria bacterium]|nr:hypothetical protein [Candidatus Auribacterota bacterium]